MPEHFCKIRIMLTVFILQYQYQTCPELNGARSEVGHGFSSLLHHTQSHASE